MPIVSESGGKYRLPSIEMMCSLSASASRTPSIVARTVVLSVGVFGSRVDVHLRRPGVKKMSAKIHRIGGCWTAARLNAARLSSTARSPSLTLLLTVSRSAVTRRESWLALASVAPGHHAAVDVEDRAGDPAGLWREEEDNGGGDVLGCSDPAQRVE